MENEIRTQREAFTASRIDDLRQEAKKALAEAQLLADVLAGKYPAARLTTAAMYDEPLVLFPGDLVMTKYGHTAIIDHFDGDIVHFTDATQLEDDRIHCVIKPNALYDEARGEGSPRPVG